MTKKPKVATVDGIPIKPISAAEQRRIERRIKKKHEKLRRRYPEVHGKKVDWISHWYEEGLCFFSVRFSELHQRQSYWTIESDLCGTPEKLAPVGGFTWACGASVRISRTDKMSRIAIVWPDGEKVFMASKMSNPWTNRNKFTFNTRGLAIYVDMTEQQVRDERKKNYEDSQVPVPENRKEQ